jgi:hypothetical protein
MLGRASGLRNALHGSLKWIAKPDPERDKACLFNHKWIE